MQKSRPLTRRSPALPKVTDLIWQMILATKREYSINIVTTGDGAGGLAVQHTRECDGSWRRCSRRALRSALAVVILAPIGAQAQTTLPDINGIATTPLSGARSTARSKPAAAPARPARTGAARAAPTPAPAAPSQPAPTPPPADAGMIDRDK